MQPQTWLQCNAAQRNPAGNWAGNQKNMMEGKSNKYLLLLLYPAWDNNTTKHDKMQAGMQKFKMLKYI